MGAGGGAAGSGALHRLTGALTACFLRVHGRLFSRLLRHEPLDFPVLSTRPLRPSRVPSPNSTR